MGRPFFFLMAIAVGLFSLPLSAQNHEWTPIGGASAGSGYTGITRADAFSINNNPAALPYVKGTTVGGFAQRSFFVEGLDLLYVAAAIPTQIGAFGVGVSHFGFDAYQQRTAHLGYGQQLAPNFSIGISLDYLNTGMAAYGQYQSATFGAGIRYKMSKKVILGAHVFNPIQVRMMAESAPVPTTMRLGLAFRSSETLTMYLETAKEWEQPIGFSAGLQYHPEEWIILRAGTTTQPVQFTVGAGIVWQELVFDLSYAYHTLLGATPAVGISYVFGQKKAAP